MDVILMSEKKWFKLDNAAKIMPSMTNSLNTNVFRITCTLKEEIDPTTLELALEEAENEFPLFLCTMKSGIFWHYLETLDKRSKVEKEKNVPCAKMEDEHLFRLTYYKKRINLEVYHVLTDGTGALEFLKYIVAVYLDYKYKLNSHDDLNKASEFLKESDSFAKFNSTRKRIKISKNKRAYKIKLQRKDDSVLDVIEVHMSTSKLKEIAHKYDTTVTIYLTAIYILSIIENAKVRDLRLPIGITIPTDLRHFFSSETTRNFFYAVGIQYRHEEGETIRCVVEYLKEKFSKEFSKENIQSLMDSYMVIEKILLIKLVPTALKDFILGVITGPRSTETTALSNLGVVKVPSQYDEYIDSFSGYMTSDGLHLTAMSYNDTTVLGFSTHFVTNEIERSMIKKLQDEGIGKIKVISNKGGVKK